MNPRSQIFNCDCMEYMRTLPDNAFDLAISDPPYGIGEDWKKRNKEMRDERQTGCVYPFCQPYRDPKNPNRQTPQWQKDMARWANNKAVFESVHFDDYEPRIGFKCHEYYVRWRNGSFK